MEACVTSLLRSKQANLNLLNIYYKCVVFTKISNCLYSFLTLFIGSFSLRQHFSGLYNFIILFQSQNIRWLKYIHMSDYASSQLSACIGMQLTILLWVNSAFHSGVNNFYTIIELQIVLINLFIFIIAT